MANMQVESEQKIAGLKEEIEDGQNALRALKQELQSRDGELVTKTQTEDDLESAKAEYQAVKLANDEYRRVLRSKNSELAQVKRESDSLAKAQSLKVKELELVSSQDQKRLAALSTENETLLKQLTEERTRNIAIDDELQRKEEVIEEH